MAPLSKPSEQLVQAVLTEVDFEHRLIAHRLRRRMGPEPMALYGFEEVLTFLFDPYPQIDIEALRVWIRDVTGDLELAERIAEISQIDRTYAEKIKLIRGVMALRYKQCKAF